MSVPGFTEYESSRLCIGAFASLPRYTARRDSLQHLPARCQQHAAPPRPGGAVQGAVLAQGSARAMTHLQTHPSPNLFVEPPVFFP